MLKKSVAYGWQNCDTLLSLSDRTLSLEVAFFSHSHNTPSRETFQHGSSKEILPTELTIAPDHAKYVILTLMLLLAHRAVTATSLSSLSLKLFLICFSQDTTHLYKILQKW